jgi:hypothetical protein
MMKMRMTGKTLHCNNINNTVHIIPSLCFALDLIHFFSIRCAGVDIKTA